MSSLQVRLSALATRIATEFNTLRGEIPAAQVKALTFYAGGTPDASEVLFKSEPPYSITITQANTVIKCDTGPSSTTVFSIKKNGTQVGTASFAASGTTATITLTSTAFGEADALSVEAPSSLNGISGVRGKFKG